jgi:hypothetical protein
MRLDLDASFFTSKIIAGAASGKLASNDIFKNYFRGLYFKVEKSGSSASNMALIDFRKGEITIKYKENTSATDATRIEKSIVLNLTGNTVSLLDQSNTNTSYANATTASNINTSLGDDKLYLKGGQGAMSIIELFGADADNNGVADKLETIRANGWLINEANLIFHVDASVTNNAAEASRIYLYDLNNHRPIFDYAVDATTGLTAKNGKLVYGGLLNKQNADDKVYKIRITNQIRNLIKNADSTNVKLGVVVTEDINTTASNKLRTSTSLFSQAPRASVMSQMGVVLYGSKSSVPEGKRLKLEIFYTKPN